MSPGCWLVVLDWAPDTPAQPLLLPVKYWQKSSPYK